MRIKIALVSVAIAIGLAVPFVSFASALSAGQVSAIVTLLQAFGVSQAVIAQVEQALGASATTSDPSDTSSTTSSFTPVSTVGSVYTRSSIGYDLSYNTKNYPQLPFGFAVIGVTAGRAFTHNARLATEFDWARMSSQTAPTFYLNVNAPYGSSATSENVSSPKICDTLFGAAIASAVAGGTYPDPTECAGYNYGWNTAKDAYAYASSQNTSATFWWLDIEEANSWSDNTAVNDEVIQGAIDYLNTKNIRVGIYSVPYMWKMIAGADFTPTDALNGSGVLVPTWFPIGISTQVKALNACRTSPSFISGSPVWIIQYEANSTAVDQNIAC